MSITFLTSYRGTKLNTDFDRWWNQLFWRSGFITSPLKLGISYLTFFPSESVRNLRCLTNAFIDHLPTLTWCPGKPDSICFFYNDWYSQWVLIHSLDSAVQSLGV